MKQFEVPSEQHVKETCQPGAGPDTCRYLAMGMGGFECLKHQPIARTVDRRARAGEMVARSDNCAGVKGGKLLEAE